MKILITGGLGFIGSNLTRDLLKNTKNKIYIVDNAKKGRLPQNLISKIHLHSTDINDLKGLEKVFRKSKPDVVIHLAAIHFIPDCDKNPVETLNVNVCGSSNIIQLCNRFNVKHVVAASSVAVYGANTIWDENATCAPNTIYGISKLAMEQLFASSCTIPYTILRLSNVYGEFEMTPHLIKILMDQYKEGGIVKYGNAKSRRDYIFANDVSRAFCAALLCKRAFGNTINISTGKLSSAADIVMIIKKHSNRKGIKFTSIRRLKRSVDTDHSVIPNKKAKNTIDWKPSITLKNGIDILLSSHTA